MTSIFPAFSSQEHHLRNSTISWVSRVGFSFRTTPCCAAESALQMRHCDISTHSFSSSQLRHHCASVISSVTLSIPLVTIFHNHFVARTSQVQHVPWLTFTRTKMFADSCFHHSASTVPFYLLLPSHNPRIAFHVSVFSRFHDDFRNTICFQICQIVSLVLPAKSPMFSYWARHTISNTSASSSGFF